jgi:hypothetical protein
MATVILSEQRQNFLSENSGYTNAYIYGNKPPQLLSGFFDNFFDRLGDIGSNILEGASNIIGGVGTGVSGYVSNPNNIAQIGGAIATGLTGMPINLQNQQGQQNYNPQPQNPLNSIMSNPALLINSEIFLRLEKSSRCNALNLTNSFKAKGDSANSLMALV